LRTREMKRFHAFLRAVVVLYLSSTLLLVAVHQHRDASQAHDCSLCALAHTPAVSVSAPPTLALTRAAESLPAATHDQVWKSESGRTLRPRAPPLA